MRDLLHSNFKQRVFCSRQNLPFLSQMYIAITNLISRFWPCLTSAFDVIDMRFYLGVCGISTIPRLWLNHTFHTVLRWLSLVTPDPSGQGLYLVYLAYMQGSVLGPIVYSFYTADVFTSILCQTRCDWSPL